MFSLVKFSDQSFSVVPSKQVENFNGQQNCCIVSGTGGERSTASLIIRSDTAGELTVLKNQLEKIAPSRIGGTNPTNGSNDGHRVDDSNFNPAKSNGLLVEDSNCKSNSVPAKIDDHPEELILLEELILCEEVIGPSEIICTNTTHEINHGDYASNLNLKLGKRTELRAASDNKDTPEELIESETQFETLRPLVISDTYSTHDRNCNNHKDDRNLDRKVSPDTFSVNFDDKEITTFRTSTPIDPDSPCNISNLIPPSSCSVSVDFSNDEDLSNGHDELGKKSRISDLSDDAINRFLDSLERDSFLLPQSPVNNNEKQTDDVHEDLQNNDSDDDDDKTFTPEDDECLSECETVSGISTASTIRNSPLPSSRKSIAPDIRELEVVKKVKDRGSKKHFCPFCHTLQTKFARHLIARHKLEDQVQRLIHLAPKSRKRMRIIDILRKKGDFIHNTKSEFNTGILIVPRRRQATAISSAEDYVCCATCKGFFGKNTIRVHRPYCNKSHKKGTRYSLAEGRRLAGYIHPSASETLRRIVFPILRDDDVVRCIKYDELIIKMGNKLCDKYTLTHQHDLIRSQLRLMGRYKLEYMKLDKRIMEFKDIFKPQNLDKAVKCLRKVAHWDKTTMLFETPAVAQNLTTLLKKCARKLRTECIKIQDREGKKHVDEFLLLWEEEIPTLINRKALEDQITQKRGKKEAIPLKQDIKILYDYLKKQCDNSLEILNERFDFDAWTRLSESTLIFIQIFNRRRAGEIERLTLQNYANKEAVDESVDPELYRKLSGSARRFAYQYVRMVLRGKLGSTVAVLLSPFAVRYIDAILKFRTQAGIKPNNEYIFTKPETTILSKKYLRACPLMRRFSKECGANLPGSLRGTKLRKHIATYTSLLGIEECQVDRLARFMGHHKDIHKNIYRIPVPVAEITEVSRLLLAAVGDEKEGGDSDDSDNSSDASDFSDEEEAIPTTLESSTHNLHTDLEREDHSSPLNDPAIIPALSESHHDTSASPPRNRKRNRLTGEDQETTVTREPEEENSGDVPSTNIQSVSQSRSGSPSSPDKVKRIRWTSEEKQAVIKYFGNLGSLPKLPSLAECKEALQKHQVLENRTPEQLKTWIDNQRRTDIRKKSHQK